MSSTAELVLTDPRAGGRQPSGPVAALFRRMIRDPRDYPFVRLSLLFTALFGGMSAVLFWPGTFRWWMAPVYWLPYAFFLGPFILMLHNTSHRVLFKSEFRLLNYYIPWVVGIFFGQSPETYYAHHLGMHHSEGNLPADLSTTMPYQRDSFVDFVKYFGNFLISNFSLPRYLHRKNRQKMKRRFILGELCYFALIGGLASVHWQATVVVFIGPTLFTRVMLMAGNWAQHAFIDHDDPTNDYKTVVTFINSVYNHRCFNDGYHLGHHLKASRHWLEMPEDFLSKKQEMIAANSLVFRKIDYFIIFLLLMFKRYDFLARFYVNLEPSKPKSVEQIVELLKARVRRFTPEELASIAAV